MIKLTAQPATTITRMSCIEDARRRLRTVVRQNPLTSEELAAVDIVLKMLDGPLHMRPDVIFSQDELDVAKI